MHTDKITEQAEYTKREPFTLSEYSDYSVVFFAGDAMRMLKFDRLRS